MMIAVMAIVFILLLGACVIGNSCASIISRVIGFNLASVATKNVLAGIKEYFSL
jgi:multiple antibiotic resistance protein